MAEKWCKQFKLCKGCKFAGNQCVVKDVETGNNSKFYDRMIQLIQIEVGVKHD
ncbi:hypothetical protein [Rosenbergiella nectarea]|uniref:hypothetical protein n=1 Tax=Rosenbergiella nectarea TaxID=988801 RepID=UPI00116002DC